MNNRREPPKLNDDSIVVIIDPDVSYEEHLKQFEQNTEEINNALAGGTGKMYSFKANGLMDNIQTKVRSEISER